MPYIDLKNSQLVHQAPPFIEVFFISITKQNLLIINLVNEILFLLRVQEIVIHSIIYVERVVIFSFEEIRTKKLFLFLVVKVYVPSTLVMDKGVIVVVHKGNLDHFGTIFLLLLSNLKNLNLGT